MILVLIGGEMLSPTSFFRLRNVLSMIAKIKLQIPQDQNVSYERLCTSSSLSAAGRCCNASMCNGSGSCMLQYNRPECQQQH